MTMMEMDVDLPLEIPKRGRPTDDSWFPNIIAWTPTYIQDYGNASLVYRSDGTRLQYGHSSVQTARDVNRYYQIDMDERRYQYQCATKRSQSVPIVLPSLTSFYVPIKARAKKDLKTSRDGTIGYVAMDAVIGTEIVQGPRWSCDSLRLFLITGQALSVNMSRSHFEEQMRCAQNFVNWLKYRTAAPGWTEAPEQSTEPDSYKPTPDVLDPFTVAEDSQD